MPQEEDVDELADLDVVRGDVLDDAGEEGGDGAAFGDELQRIRFKAFNPYLSIMDRIDGRTAISLFKPSSFSLSLLDSRCFRIFLTLSSLKSK